MPTIDRSEPAYLQVARHIREQITSGQLAEGDTVPSARQIMADWGVAIATANRALATLRAEGLVRGVPGVGTVVQTRRVHRSARDHSITALRTGRIYPPGHYAKILRAELRPAPEQVADALGIDAGMPVIMRQRTTYDGHDVPLSTSISWFEGALAGPAPRLLQPDRILQGTATYIAEQAGRQRSPRERVLMSAGTATADESRELRIDEGAPVLRGRNFYWDTEGAVIEYGESVSPAGLEASFEYDVEEGS